MGWRYHFIDLTDAQKHERRELLDRYAWIAQRSVILPLLVMQCYFLASWIRRRWANNADATAPSSPYLKEKRLGSWAITRALKSRAKGLAWWLGGEAEMYGSSLGSRGQVLIALAWTMWLLILCFADTGEDYLHLKFGTIAAAQLPLHYLLSVKFPLSPLQLLTGSSHETLNAYHQLLGRVATFLLYLHAVLYLNFYVQKSLLAVKVKEAYVLCGIVGIIAFTIVGTTALTPVRRWSYRVFYITHVTLATVLLPVLFFHVTHIRIYLYETAAIYALSFLSRSLCSRTFPGTVTAIRDTSLVEIKIALPDKELSRWHPGQHAYLSLPGHPLSRTVRSNPLTVASLPSTQTELRFYARILDGNTAKLAHQASLSNSIQELTVEGPYGVRTHADQLLQYDRVLFVAGGIGATFIVPLYRQLLADLSPSKGSYRRQKVSFVWAAHSIEDVTWALPGQMREREGFVERLDVYITRDSRRGVSARASINQREEYVDEEEEGIELEERKNLLYESEVSTGNEDDETKALCMAVYAGRPRLDVVVDLIFTDGMSEKIAILVCGPKGLRSPLRDEVGRWVRKGREVWFWEEVFAL
ncbi:hypothetical protein LTR37_008715 [Vermiconidia calcicola]|uniref:Uncharacterized protein n=1 Tax=Vermiconidia calcicola TaxID=1690605 RepID=A0ACC3N9Q8_9PEZI|nr:hypothetical protein LTR37_008715 [Vermiconidia calcicola]